MTNYVWLIPIAPLLAAILVGVLALVRPGAKFAPALTIVAVLLSLGVALGVNPHGAGAHAELTWLSIPPRFDIALGVHLDAMSWMMVLVVCIVSALVQIYSIGYMKGDNGYARYFGYLSLFTASMLGLVTANNLFQLYVCWELVGICSYLLIGFWWFKPSAASAAKKAFVVTRFGDVGFLIGVLLLSAAAGSFRFDAAADAVANIAHGQAAAIPLVSGTTFLWLAPLLLFCGAVGKSAQFPLHVWLPDAMEGPTPVSALIHAATMVAAGVYMVARLMPVFAASSVALDVVLLIGAITAFVAATIAMVYIDIKKVLAYSTISQLGYMMLGLGTGGEMGQTAGMFHLLTHAFFKALLFLSAGSVIHALHHSEEPNNLRRMGGLMKRMPHTAITCLIGVLALAGFPALSGWASKDGILAAAFAAATNPGGVRPAPVIALFGGVVGVIVAGITAFYALRLWFMAFYGSPRSPDAGAAHESPLVMTVPLWVLAVPSVVLGLLLEGRFERFLEGTPATIAGAGNTAEVLAGVAQRNAHVSVMAVTTLVAFAGMAVAWWLYARPTMETDPIERLPSSVYNILVGLWGVETFWNTVGARGTLAFGRMVAWFDRHVVDGAMNGIGWLCGQAGSALRRSANGQAQSYAGAMVAAALILAVLLALFGMGAGPTHERNLPQTPSFVRRGNRAPRLGMVFPSPYQGEGKRVGSSTSLRSIP